jgi:hypothetical protein
MGSGAMINSYIPSFIKTDSSIQKLTERDSQAYGKHCHRIRLLPICQNKESKLRIFITFYVLREETVEQY